MLMVLMIKMSTTMRIWLSERMIRKWMKKEKQLLYNLAGICVKKYASVVYSS